MGKSCHNRMRKQLMVPGERNWVLCMQRSSLGSEDPGDDGAHLKLRSSHRICLTQCNCAGLIRHSLREKQNMMKSLSCFFFISRSSLIYGRNSLYTRDPYVGKNSNLAKCRGTGGSLFSVLKGIRTLIYRETKI